jgi:AraC family transcriptional regulator
MLKLYDLLENILLDIENNIKNNINASVLSKKYDFSESHLRKIFSFVFNRSVASYIRSRILTATLNDLLETDNDIIDIAIKYGFEYEQSYIRTFKREFGITPGHLRKTRQVIQIKPPLHLFDKRRLDNGILFGPDFVMVPRFHVIGKRHHLTFKDLPTEPLLTKQFWENERKQIKETVNPHACINVSCNLNLEKGHFDYVPSLQVKNLKDIPPGLSGETFDTSMCVRFRYIGQHHYYEINSDVVSMMYNAVSNFAQDKNAKYVLIHEKSNFVKIDERLYDGTYCQMEYYTPVCEKQ